MVRKPDISVPRHSCGAGIVGAEAISPPAQRMSPGGNLIRRLRPFLPAPLYALDHSRNALPQTYAHSGNTQGQIPVLHYVQQ